MYLDYFGFAEPPFSITPDPAFVYLSARHRDALAHLLYAVGQGGAGGFVQLTGEVGTGKTTLCRCLLEQVPEGTHVALVLNPLMSPHELLLAICQELRIDTEGAEPGSKALVDRLNAFLLDAHARGERVVVVIDEAQNLSIEALEQVRLLTNLETDKQKLLQIVLLGQPELRELLQRRSLRQLAQRITARYHLTPLNSAETAAYVAHRVSIAGAQRNPFSRKAMRALFQRSHGIPRLINIIADRALVAAYARERTDVDARLVHAAADEVQLGEPAARRAAWPWLLATAGGVLLALLVIRWLPIQEAEPRNRPEPVAQADAAPTAVAEEALPAPDPDHTWFDVQNLAAWAGLATLWGDSADAGNIQRACQGGVGQGDWACLRLDGSLSRIRQLGLPVILQLRGDQDQLLLLQGVSGDRLLCGAPGSEATVSRGAVEARWLGSYFVAWPQARGWPREIQRGDQGPAVRTVIDLARRAEPAYRGEDAFEAGFERWLRDFQRRHALEVDGIVGPQTLLYLIRPSIEQPALKTDW